MGAKAKLSTKVLSFFLSVLMAVSCFGIVLPSLSPAASAADVTEEQWAALKDALAAAVAWKSPFVSHPVGEKP